jgi:hypothetical protein
MSDSKQAADGAAKDETPAVDVAKLQAALAAEAARGDALEMAAETRAAELNAAQSRVFELEATVARLSDDVVHRDRIIAGLQAEIAKHSPDPIGVELTAPHGFIDEANGRNHYWNVGQVVTDPDEIALLKERQASLKPAYRK